MSVLPPFEATVAWLAGELVASGHTPHDVATDAAMLAAVRAVCRANGLPTDGLTAEGGLLEEVRAAMCAFAPPGARCAPFTISLH